MRAELGGNDRNVRDLLRDLGRFTHGGGGIGELSAYLRPQAAMFDVLASDESATAGEMLTAGAFRDLRDVVTQFYKLIIVDTGNNVRAANWRAAIDATDQIVITRAGPQRLGRDGGADARPSRPHGPARTGAPCGRRGHRGPAARRRGPRRGRPAVHREAFPGPCRAVLRVPYDRHLDSGAPIDYGAISAATRRSWLRVAAAVLAGL